MSVNLQPPLSVLADWIEAGDSHARHRLALLADAQRVLSGRQETDARQRHELATRLERWRYQHLDEHRGRPNPLGRRLSEVLDLAANQLAGRDPRPPRWPRDAIRDTTRDAEGMARAVAALDPCMPLQDVAQQAAELTGVYFAARPSGVKGDSPIFVDTKIGTVPDQPLSTVRRRMLLYAPIYLSSHCVNYCVYCGFRHAHALDRKHLSIDEAMHQADILGRRGFRHILLVAGDFPRLTSTRYFVAVIRAMADRGIRAAVEIAPQTIASYSAMAAAGACGVTLYQETYNEPLYTMYHPRGTKSLYDWRLEGLERAAEAGISRLGLGILLGLADPREDLPALVRHARYLQSRFPHCTLAFSLPRIHDAPVGFEPPYPVDDETFVRLYCALRLAFPRAELVLSTRECAELRNRLAGICITQFSAGSSTVPGGYENGGTEPANGGQFLVHDRRSPAEVAAWLRAAGFEVAWEIAAR